VAPGAARIVGRTPELGADIIIEHGTMHRRHAVFTNRDGELSVQDLGSHCGVMVNEEAIGFQGARSLTEGDVVRLGQVRLRVSDAVPIES
jgi:pSer/pThr/pTyr-binding forkhead associated (FHA) protein